MGSEMCIRDSNYILLNKFFFFRGDFIKEDHEQFFPGERLPIVSLICCRGTLRILYQDLNSRLKINKQEEQKKIIRQEEYIFVERPLLTGR